MSPFSRYYILKWSSVMFTMSWIFIKEKWIRNLYASVPLVQDGIKKRSPYMKSVYHHRLSFFLNKLLFWPMRQCAFVELLKWNCRDNIRTSKLCQQPHTPSQHKWSFPCAKICSSCVITEMWEQQTAYASCSSSPRHGPGIQGSRALTCHPGGGW